MVCYPAKLVTNRRSERGSNIVDHTYRIYFDGAIIEATNDHPFFMGVQWLEVEQLSAGDSLTRYDQQKVVIDSITYEKGTFEVFTFEVADYHTYYVSDQHVLVHNDGPCPAFIESSQKIAPDLLDKGVHFNVGKIELRAVPNHAGGVSFKAVHPGMVAKKQFKSLYSKALKDANNALHNSEFRGWLKKHAQKGFDMAGSTNR